MTAYGAHFVDPFVLHVFERVGCVDGECDEDDVRFGIGEGTETFVFFLSSVSNSK
jgi:hypothetical protein